MATTEILHALFWSATIGIVKLACSIRLSDEFVINVYLEVLTPPIGISHGQETVLHQINNIGKHF